MSRYRLSSDAKQDLDRIFDHVARKGRGAAAERLIDQITDRFPFLAANPRAGRMRDEIDPGVRSFPFGSYVIYYRIRTPGVEIVRVLHGGREQGTAFRSRSGRCE